MSFDVDRVIAIGSPALRFSFKATCSYSWDSAIRLWDVASGRAKQRYRAWEVLSVASHGI